MEVVAKIKISDILKFHGKNLVENTSSAAVKALLFPFGIAIYVGFRRGTDTADAMIGLFYLAATLGAFALFGILLALLYFGMILASLDENQPLGDVRYTISHTALTVDSDGRNEIFAWADLTSSGNNMDFIWMQFSGRHYRFIPECAIEEKQLFEAAWRVIEEIGGHK